MFKVLTIWDLLFSQRSGCKKESSEFCFLSGWSSKSSFSVEKLSWLRASSLKPVMGAEGKMEGSEHRRLKGFVKVSNIASENMNECRSILVCIDLGSHGALCCPHETGSQLPHNHNRRQDLCCRMLSHAGGHQKRYQGSSGRLNL